MGGGYVGLEAAASARALGTEVVLLERLDRVLKRVASETLSTFFTGHHRAEGVDIRLEVEVARFEDGGVLLSDGTQVAGDVILVGIGALANDSLARAAGLACDPSGSGGIIVDETARTSDPTIYAIGDVTVRPVPVHGCTMRLESVPNAQPSWPDGRHPTDRACVNCPGRGQRIQFGVGLTGYPGAQAIGRLGP